MGEIGTAPRLRFRVTKDARGLACVTTQLKANSRRSQPVLVEVGNITIPIYHTPFKNKQGIDYDSFTIIYRGLDGARKRETRSTLKKAQTRAGEIATAIHNGEYDLQARAKQLGLSVQQVFARGEQEILKDRAATAIVHKPSAAVVAEYLLKRRAGPKWLRNLSGMLDRFTAWHPEPLADLTARAIDDWLDQLIKNNNAGLQTRRNHRDAIASLVAFAKSRAYVHRDFDPMAEVPDHEPAPPAVNLYTPDELVKLLTVAESSAAGRKLVPLICITAFAGVRHGEMREEKIRLLDWADIDFETKTIYVGKAAAKTGRDRVVDMPPNLIAWLQYYRRESGPICSLKFSADALCKLRAAARIFGPKQNALRKSFISYKNAQTRDIAAVADQAGNSAAMIRKHYKRTDARMRRAAERWFNIMPVRADVLPIFDWQREAQVVTS